MNNPLSNVRIAYIAVLAFFSFLTPRLAQCQAPDEETQFDTVEIGALNLAFDVKKWVTKLTPKPTAGFAMLVQTRPILIVAQENGKRWFIRPPDKRVLVPIDPAKFALQTQDLDAAEKLLDIHYLTQWISCMRAALNGSASEDCIAELCKLAQAETEPTKSLLLANLGARLSSLGARNPQWQAALQRAASDPSSPAGIALAAYRKLEYDKVMMVLKFHPTQAMSNGFELSQVVQPNYIPNEDWSSYSWSDVVTTMKARYKTPGGSDRVIIWILDSDAKPIPITDQTSKDVEGVMATYVLSTEQHIMLIGKVTGAKMDEILQASSLKQLIVRSQQCQLDPLLSRPGSGTVFTLVNFSSTPSDEK
jgi:hypothetical protein